MPERISEGTEEISGRAPGGISRETNEGFLGETSKEILGESV